MIEWLKEVGQERVPDLTSELLEGNISEGNEVMILFHDKNKHQAQLKVF